MRGVHLDCRAQMLRYERIVETLHDLARWGFNAVLFEYENRFPFSGRLRGIPSEDALTRAQVRGLERAARSLGIRIIPLVHCLAHLEYALRVPALSRLREGAAGRAATTVCPSHPGARALFREMVSQVLDLHDDCRWFHMGGDEAALSESCPRCAPRVDKRSLSRVLVEHYAERADWVRSQGPDPILWGDMILSNPEALGVLRGRATIMDWDYWSLQKPRDQARIWGARGGDFRRPSTWPPLHHGLFARYILTADGKAARPFPYAAFLRDQGFQTLIAPAARSAGDNFCVPAPHHIENAIGAAKTAHRERLLGSVVTSWALRRAPWPLTENTLIAAGMALRDPATPREEMDARFAQEHFNVADPDLARIPLLLGAPLDGLCESRPRFDPLTGHWFGADFEQRVEKAQSDPARHRAQSRALAGNVRKAQELLQRAKPATARQRERVALWNWAAETLSFFTRVAPQLLVSPGGHRPDDLRRLRREARALDAGTTRRLSALYTDFTLIEEQQTRSGLPAAWLDAMLRRTAAENRPRNHR